eukprot:gnl/MRDRNA2_/MRDRNA2_71697_c0_seq1.p1 gnl/MRDRNA2_/MRDRNA2_71697_c0~~gnl/MRDRNA2_/MRDRNA2_71697_c0_seq1.p1  ORF type:complete len:163 (-),score=26.40 gnl/MRDRNA2_/MRDRNA2_71697_c0_seq1:87-575(-)
MEIDTCSFEIVRNDMDRRVEVWWQQRPYDDAAYQRIPAFTEDKVLNEQWLESGSSSIPVELLLGRPHEICVKFEVQGAEKSRFEEKCQSKEAPSRPGEHVTYWVSILAGLQELQLLASDLDDHRILHFNAMSLAMISCTFILLAMLQVCRQVFRSTYVPLMW